MADEGPVMPEAQVAAAETVIVEPGLPAHLKESAPDVDPDWNAKALEALAKQLSETNDFYYPLLDAARELRDLRTHRAATNGQSLYKIYSSCEFRPLQIIINSMPLIFKPLRLIMLPLFRSIIRGSTARVRIVGATTCTSTMPTR